MADSPWDHYPPDGFTRDQEEQRWAKYERALAAFADAHRAFAETMHEIGLLDRYEPGARVGVRIKQTPEEMIQGFAELASENAEWCVDLDALDDLRAFVRRWNAMEVLG